MMPSPRLRHKATKVFYILTDLRVNYVFDAEKTFPFYKPLRENQNQMQPRLCLSRSFALGTGKIFSRAKHRLDVFPRFEPLTFFPELATACMFSRAWHRFCIPALTSVYSPFVIRVRSIKNFTVHYLRECACLGHDVVHSDWLISRLRR